MNSLEWEHRESMHNTRRRINKRNQWVWIRDSRKGNLRIRPFKRLLDAVAEHLGVQGYTATIVWTNDQKIKELKHRYLGVDEPTDVLAFPFHETWPDGTHYLGDIVISLDTAYRQAGEKGHDLTVEVAILLIHGLLHLLGYDHETDQGEMSALETELRREFLAIVSDKIESNH